MEVNIMSMQNELNKDWLDMVLKKSLEKWSSKNASNEELEIAEKFAEFTKEISDVFFLDDEYEE